MKKCLISPRRIYNFYAAAAGIPALAALYWKKATSQGMIAAVIGGFVTCAVWRALGSPFPLQMRSYSSYIAAHLG